jgi:hypothetical protein
MFLDHTQRRCTVGWTPLDVCSARPEACYRLCCVVVCDLETSRMGAPYVYDISHLRVKLESPSNLTKQKYTGCIAKIHRMYCKKSSTKPRSLFFVTSENLLVEFYMFHDRD